MFLNLRTYLLWRRGNVMNGNIFPITLYDAISDHRFVMWLKIWLESFNPDQQTVIEVCRLVMNGDEIALKAIRIATDEMCASWTKPRSEITWVISYHLQNYWCFLGSNPGAQWAEREKFTFLAQTHCKSVRN